MELKAQYTIEDLVALVEKDLKDKGFQLTSQGVEISFEQLDRDGFMRLDVEQIVQVPLVSTNPNSSKPSKEVSQKELARREKLSASMTKKRADEKAAKEAAKTQKHLEADYSETEQDTPIENPLTVSFQQEILNSIEEIKRENQEVVATTPSPFQLSPISHQRLVTS